MIFIIIAIVLWMFSIDSTQSKHSASIDDINETIDRLNGDDDNEYNDY